MPDDPREMIQPIVEAVESLMDTVGRMQVLAAGGGTLKLVYQPDEGAPEAPFEVPGDEKDRPYVAGRMGEIKSGKIDVALAHVNALAARIDALR